ncbi:MAG TPA: AAA family ATPase [Opitutaceae bacterium]
MRFIFIYGKPATGKLTIAREVARRTGLRLFHNHLIVDAVKAVYDFGTPGFVALRDELWRTAFTRLTRDPALEGLIFTFNPENSVPQAFVDDLFALFDQAGATIHCIELTCPEEEIERRLDSASRHEFDKLTDVALYRSLREQGVFETPVIRRNRLVIDTTTTPPIEAAQRIAALI